MNVASIQCSAASDCRVHLDLPASVSLGTVAAGPQLVMFSLVGGFGTHKAFVPSNPNSPHAPT
eukprot:2181299-Amphidinium_carterae.1